MKSSDKFSSVFETSVLALLHSYNRGNCQLLTQTAKLIRFEVKFIVEQLVLLCFTSIGSTEKQLNVMSQLDVWRLYRISF